MDQLRLTALLKKPDIICISETWLHSLIDSELVALPNYTLCRSDCLSRRGGGACIFTDKKFHSSCCTPDVVLEEFEVTAVDLCDQKLIVICLYVPPNLCAEKLAEIENFICYTCDSLLSQRPNHNIILAGDTNSLNCMNLCEGLAMFDIVNEPTRGKSTLDHILVSNPLSPIYDSKNTQYLSPLGNADHKSIFISPSETEPATDTVTYHKLLDLRLSNLQCMYRDLVEITLDWSPLT